MGVAKQSTDSLADAVADLADLSLSQQQQKAAAAAVEQVVEHVQSSCSAAAAAQQLDLSPEQDAAAEQCAASFVELYEHVRWSVGYRGSELADNTLTLPA